MTTEPHDHKEQGYEGTGLGPADHQADRPDTDSEAPDEGGGHGDGRSRSAAQEDVGDS